jgi:hypothetical protein
MFERRKTWGQAALNQAAVSNALLIIGMFMPKLGLVPFFGTTLTAGLTVAAVAVVGATSAARSHDPVSWERATEKNRST